MTRRRSTPLADPHAERAAAPLPPPPPPAVSFDELSCLGRLQARWLPALPAPATLVCRHVPSARDFWVTTSRRHFDAAQRVQWPCMHGSHWLACVVAAAAGASMLAVGQWLIPRQPPPRAPAPPDWMLLGKLIDLLGPHARQYAEDSNVAKVFAEVESSISVHDVLDHFACKLISIDPDVVTWTDPGSEVF